MIFQAVRDAKKFRQFSVNDGSTYSRVHSQLHGKFQTFLDAFGYYDIFLVPIKLHSCRTALFILLKIIDTFSNVRLDSCILKQIKRRKLHSCRIALFILPKIIDALSNARLGF